MFRLRFTFGVSQSKHCIVAGVQSTKQPKIIVASFAKGSFLLNCQCPETWKTQGMPTNKAGCRYTTHLHGNKRSDVQKVVPRECEPTLCTAWSVLAMLERCMDLAPVSCFATWGCELASNCQCHALFDAHLIYLSCIFLCYKISCYNILLCQLCKVDPESFDFQTVVSQMSPTVFLGTLGWFHLKEQCRAQQRGLFKDACVSSVACILHFFAFIFLCYNFHTRVKSCILRGVNFVLFWTVFSLFV